MGSEMRTIESAWLSFEEAVIPKSAGRAQRSDMKKAFYSGTASALVVLLNISIKESESRAMEVLQGIVDEALGFLKEEK